MGPNKPSKGTDHETTTSSRHSDSARLRRRRNRHPSSCSTTNKHCRFLATSEGKLQRLARALYLTCEREGAGLYRVSGGAESHAVTLGEDPRCDCTDYAVRGGPCKHLLRARLARGDSEVIKALQLLVAYPQTSRSGSGTRRG